MTQGSRQESGSRHSADTFLSSSGTEAAEGAVGEQGRVSWESEDEGCESDHGFCCEAWDEEDEEGREGDSSWESGAQQDSGTHSSWD